jgi:hypothetical protein
MPVDAREPAPTDAQAAAAPPAVADAEEIMRVVLAKQARTVREWGSREFCIEAQIPDATFAPLRRALIKRASRPPGAKVEGIEILGDFGWQVPRDSGKGYQLGTKAPSKEALRPIANAVLAITNGPEPPQLVRNVDAAWLPIPLKLCQGEPQQPYLEIYGPVLQGDIAFVEADYFCPLCGQGLIYALERDRSTWKIVAMTETWAS